MDVRSRDYQNLLDGNVIGWVDYHIFLPMVLSRAKTRSRLMTSTTFSSQNDVDSRTCATWF